MKRIALVAAWLIALCAPVHAQEPKPLFASSEPLHIAIQSSLDTLIRDRSITSAIPGSLIDPNGLALPISLALRGHVNRTNDVCEFPPLRVEFTSPPPPASVFAGQKKLKLVTHCRNSASNQQYILLDYASYKMYNVLTPRSFLARLATIDYRGADGRPIISRVGFFIEDEKDLAKRNGMREVKVNESRIPIEDLSPQDAARYALFQHMIANHDWSMRAAPAGENCCHNAKLIGDLAPGATVPVAYDFDFSGLVGSPYASPPDQLHIGSVRERVYRGYCVHNAEVLAVARQMRDAEPQMIAALTSTPGLQANTAARAMNFLNGFFQQIASDADVTKNILTRCVR